MPHRSSLGARDDNATMRRLLRLTALRPTSRTAEVSPRGFQAFPPDDAQAEKKGWLSRLADPWVFGTLFPALALFGGSTNLINWGPGLALAGAALLALAHRYRRDVRRVSLHACLFLLLLGLLLLRAANSPDAASAAHNAALIGMAAAGHLVGQLMGANQSRCLFTGLAVVAVIHLSCTLIQTTNPEWNLIYPGRSGGFPSGLFAHYNESASFCLGCAGLLASGRWKERGLLKTVMTCGSICALASIPLTLSRGGNLALAFMVAMLAALMLARAFRDSGSALSTWLPVSVLVAMTIIFGTSVVPLIGRKMGSAGFYDDGCRIEFWQAAIEIAKQHPWIGGGAGSFSWNVFHVLTGLNSEPTMVHHEALQLAVDYGYPALVMMAVLIAAPLIRLFWRLAKRLDSPANLWEAAALAAMLAQSNFSFVFQTAPGSFLAALILGRISRGMWNTHASATRAQITPGRRDSRQQQLFLTAVENHVADFFSGQRGAVSALTALLLGSKKEDWLTCGYDLIFWNKTLNTKALRHSMRSIAEKCSDEKNPLPPPDEAPCGREITAAGRKLQMAGKLALAGCAIPLLWFGSTLGMALVQAWRPLYHPQQMSNLKRFQSLLCLMESHHGLGIDRKVLAAGIDCIYQLKSQQAREYLATRYQQRLRDSVTEWRGNPGTALQLACVLGWAGDVKSAMRLHDHAIISQGCNESLFMAHAFKGQYLYELSISAGTLGRIDQQKSRAGEAAACFRNSMAQATWRLPGELSKMLEECEVVLKP